LIPRAAFCCRDSSLTSSDFTILRDPLRNKSQGFNSGFVSHWNFSTFSPMGSVWVMPQQAANGRATTGCYPPHLKKHGSYPGEFRAMRLYKNRRA